LFRLPLSQQIPADVPISLDTNEYLADEQNIGLTPDAMVELNVTASLHAKASPVSPTAATALGSESAAAAAIVNVLRVFYFLYKLLPFCTFNTSFLVSYISEWILLS
jgi:hypothetical protein